MQNLLKSEELNCGPLSATKVSGYPNLENTQRKTLIVASEVVLDILMTSGYLL